MYLFLSLPFSHPQQTVQMLCLPPLKQGERIIWPLGGFQVRDLLGFSWSFQDLLKLLGTYCRDGGGLLSPQLVWNSHLSVP